MFDKMKKLNIVASIGKGDKGDKGEFFVIYEKSKKYSVKLYYEDFNKLIFNHKL